MCSNKKHNGGVSVTPFMVYHKTLVTLQLLEKRKEIYRKVMRGNNFLFFSYGINRKKNCDDEAEMLYFMIYLLTNKILNSFDHHKMPQRQKVQVQGRQN